MMRAPADCCDGSDEASGKCRNSCLDRSAHERQATRDHVAFVHAALEQKKALIAKANAQQQAWKSRKGLVGHETSAQAKEVTKLEGEGQGLCVPACVVVGAPPVNRRGQAGHG